MRTKRENLTPWAEEGIAWLQARTEEAAERQRQDDALHAEVAEHVASAGDRACGQCGYLKCSCFYAQKVSIRFDEAAKAIAERLEYRDAQLLRSIGSGGGLLLEEIHALRSEDVWRRVTDDRTLRDAAERIVASTDCDTEYKLLARVQSIWPLATGYVACGIISEVWREHVLAKVTGAVEAHEDSRMVSKTGTVDVE